LWLGVAMGSESLKELAQRLNQALEAAGFPAEKRPLRPHITLARCRSKMAAAALRGAPLPPRCPETVIDRFHLFQSRLDSQGAHYTRLHMAKLMPRML
jgi:RNA 2',3'-cyclic 3'-phosphodiesterase